MATALLCDPLVGVWSDGTLQKKDLLFWQLYFSLELQLFTWFYGMILE